jgi:hypothetical protein
LPFQYLCVVSRDGRSEADASVTEKDCGCAPTSSERPDQSAQAQQGGTPFHNEDRRITSSATRVIAPPAGFIA